MTRLRVLPDAEAVARHAADQLALRIAGAREEGREIHIALAGGRTPQRAYELLAAIEGSWAHVHLWLGDERCVPADDPESNARMVRASLLARSRPQPPVLHDVPSPEQPEDAAWLYGLQIRDEVPGAIFDVVLLGMGPDGHTASLFPGFPQLSACEAPCVAVRDSPKPPPERVTLTFPVLRGARFTQLLATGAEKAGALARARAGDRAVPVALLGDDLDEIACDRAAAGEDLPDQP
ncbi:MAG: 6-phosphogluconolactonase [Solirubrobacteraceae bacterium]|jgi:6-phosphogluconolactonase|nr:6-phosphogluconolactonase [Solirubrobacteraceae bacterium]